MTDQSQTRLGRIRGRRVTACVECRKRKKKCDRRWPCNHCRRRQSAHECKYGIMIAPDEHDAPQAVNSFTKEPVSRDVLAEASAAVLSLGYMDDPVLKMIAVKPQSSETMSLELSSAALQASRAVPPRPYADILVQSFFDHVNHHYCILYKPSFLASYEDWWSRRRDASYSRTLPTVALTALILRVCSNAIQFLPKDAQDGLESDLGDSVANLSQLYHEAAHSLSDLLPPGVAGLVDAQQLFLGATWLKAEANFLESWHMLAASVRQAQEIGIDTDKTTPDLTGYEQDSRRRLWCALDTWDKFMAALFNRPPIIGPHDPVPYPSSTLNLLGIDSEAPSQALAKILENQLGRVLSDTKVTRRSLEGNLALVEHWMSALPPVFSFLDSEKRWDDESPWLRFQRLQLHCVGYMTQLALLKKALALEPLQSIYKEKAAEISLLAMNVCYELFRLCFRHQAKYFMVAFCPFDVAALLCSLLLRDREKALPRRNAMVSAIGTALSISPQLRGYTKMGESTWAILNALVAQLQLEREERRTLEEIAEAHDLTGREPQSRPKTPEPLSDKAAASLNQPQNNVGLSTNTQSNADLGVLGGVWDWQNLFPEFEL